MRCEGVFPWVVGVGIFSLVVLLTIGLSGVIEYGINKHDIDSGMVKTTCTVSDNGYVSSTCSQTHTYYTNDWNPSTMSYRTTSHTYYTSYVCYKATWTTQWTLPTDGSAHSTVETQSILSSSQQSQVYSGDALAWAHSYHAVGSSQTCWASADSYRLDMPSLTTGIILMSVGCGWMALYLVVLGLIALVSWMCECVPVCCSSIGETLGRCCGCMGEALCGCAGGIAAALGWCLTCGHGCSCVRQRKQQSPPSYASWSTSAATTSGGGRSMMKPPTVVNAYRGDDDETVQGGSPDRRRRKSGGAGPRRGGGGGSLAGSVSGTAGGISGGAGYEGLYPPVYHGDGGCGDDRPNRSYEHVDHADGLPPWKQGIAVADDDVPHAPDSSLLPSVVVVAASPSYAPHCGAVPAGAWSKETGDSVAHGHDLEKGSGGGGITAPSPRTSSSPPAVVVYDIRPTLVSDVPSSYPPPPSYDATVVTTITPTIYAPSTSTTSCAHSSLSSSCSGSSSSSSSDSEFLL